MHPDHYPRNDHQGDWNAHYLVSDFGQNKQFSFTSPLLGYSWSLELPLKTEAIENGGFLVAEYLSAQNHSLVFAIAFERQNKKMQRGLILAALATCGLGFTQTISKDSLPFGLITVV